MQGMSRLLAQTVHANNSCMNRYHRSKLICTAVPCAQDLAEQLEETADVVMPILAASGGQGDAPVQAALEAAGLPCVGAPADALAWSDRSRWCPCHGKNPSLPLETDAQSCRVAAHPLMQPGMRVAVRRHPSGCRPDVIEPA